MKTIVVDGREFTQISMRSFAGEVLDETYFSNDREGVQVTVSYRYAKTKPSSAGYWNNEGGM